MKLTGYNYRLGGVVKIFNEGFEFTMERKYVTMGYQSREWWLREVGIDPLFFAGIFWRKQIK